MPFNYFLEAQDEEPTKETPMEFHPDDGQKYRSNFEQKFGYRGERLIAMLGRGSAPLSVYEASLSDGKPSSTTASSAEPHTEASFVKEVTSLPHNHTQEVGEEEPTTRQPFIKNYVEIDRRPKTGFLTESFFDNNAPQKESYSLSPEGIVYNRLYGAIWNYGEKGLSPESQRIASSSGFGSLPGISTLYTPRWSSLDNLQFENLPGVSQNIFGGLEDYNPSPDVVNGNYDTVPSESEYAGGLGEPSILVKSYSYRR